MSPADSSPGVNDNDEMIGAIIKQLVGLTLLNANTRRSVSLAQGEIPTFALYDAQMWQ